MSSGDFKVAQKTNNNALPHLLSHRHA